MSHGIRFAYWRVVMRKIFDQWFWFIGGFALGFSLIAIGHASIPKKAASVTELKASKAVVIDMDQEYSNLTHLESKFAESSIQQKKLKAATSRNARRARN